MNQDLIDQVRGAKILDRQAAVKRYAELLEAGGVENAEELIELADQLGKSPDQISADAQTLATFGELETRVNIAVQKKAREKFHQAKAAKLEYEAETARIVQEREARRLELDQLEFEAHASFKSAAGAEDTLHRLQRQYGELLGGRTIAHV